MMYTSNDNSKAFRNLSRYAVAYIMTHKKMPQGLTPVQQLHAERLLRQLGAIKSYTIQ